MNSDYNFVTLLKSGVKFRYPHATSRGRRLDKSASRCNLRVFKTTDSYGYRSLIMEWSTYKAVQVNCLKDAFHTALCPLCGNQMDQDIA